MPLHRQGQMQPGYGLMRRLASCDDLLGFRGAPLAGVEAPSHNTRRSVNDVEKIAQVPQAKGQQSQSEDCSEGGKMTTQSPLRQECAYQACYCEENVYKLCEQLIRDQVAPSNELFACFVSNPFKQVALWQQRAGDPESDGVVVWDYHVLLLQVPSPPPAAAALPPPHLEQASPAPVTPQQEQQSFTAGGGGTTQGHEQQEQQQQQHGQQQPQQQQPQPQQQHNQQEVLVWDLDTQLPFPCPAALYSQRALRHDYLRDLQTHDTREWLRRWFRVVPAAAYLSHFSSDRHHMQRPPPSSSDSDEQDDAEARVRWLATPPPWPLLSPPNASSPHTLPQFWDIGTHNWVGEGRGLPGWEGRQGAGRTGESSRRLGGWGAYTTRTSL